MILNPTHSVCLLHSVLYPPTVNSSPLTNNGQSFSFTQKSCFRLNVHAARQALTCSTRGCPHHGWCGATKCGRWPDLTWQLHPIYSTGLSFLYGMRYIVLLLPGYGLQGQASELQLRHQRLLSIALLYLRSLIGRLPHILVSISDQSNKQENFGPKYSPQTPVILLI